MENINTCPNVVKFIKCDTCSLWFNPVKFEINKSVCISCSPKFIKKEKVRIVKACTIWNFDEEEESTQKDDVKSSKSSKTSKSSKSSKCCKNDEKRVECVKCKLNFHKDEFVYKKDPMFVNACLKNVFISKNCKQCRLATSERAQIYKSIRQKKLDIKREQEINEREKGRYERIVVRINIH